MKYNFFKLRKVTVGLAFASIMTAVAAPVFANNKKETIHPVLNTQPAVKFVGTDVSGSVFHVTFDAEKQVKFELSVRDVNGDVLFRNTYETENFSKYIKLMNDGGDDVSNTYFTIRILPNGEVHTFDVSSNVILVKDVIVKKQ
jgi:hypothetical protein